jgi:hypothetical protein
MMNVMYVVVQALIGLVVSVIAINIMRIVLESVVEIQELMNVVFVMDQEYMNLSVTATTM